LNNSRRWRVNREVNDETTAESKQGSKRWQRVNRGVNDGRRVNRGVNEGRRVNRGVNDSGE
jgi:hypothetical protein